MSDANTQQVGGSHWIRRPIQCWDYIAANNMNFFEGNIIKYVTRYKEKNGVEDLLKARHYLDKLLELANDAIKKGESKSG